MSTFYQINKIVFSLINRVKSVIKIGDIVISSNKLRKILKRILFITGIYSISYSTSFSQTAMFEFQEVIIKDNMDTLIVNRKPGEFFYGIHGSIMYSNYYGKFVFPEIILPGQDQYTEKINFDMSGYIPSYEAGLRLIYRPKNSQFGYTSNLTLEWLNSKFNKSIKDTLQTSFEHNLSSKYLTFTPQVQYFPKFLKNSFMEGLHFQLGIYYSLPLKTSSQQKKIFFNPEQIEENTIYDNKNESKYINAVSRFGGEFLIALNVFGNNITGIGRTIITPYFGVNFGTKLNETFSDNNITNTLNVVNLKLGVFFVFGFDNTIAETYKYHPTTNSEIDNYSSIDQEFFNVANLEYEEFETDLMEPIFINPEPVIETPKLAVGIELTTKIQKPVVVLDQKFILNYSRSENDVELNNSGNDFLQEIADFMQDNPRCIIIIEGYNDDRGGSLQENQLLSIERAENAKKELIKRGINAGRIVTSGKGAVKPIASNSTSLGRIKNRRIEIIIKQPKMRKK